MFYQKEVVKSLELEEVPTVDFLCTLCSRDVAKHGSECSGMAIGSDYLWLVRYFQKYASGSLWGKWIQDSLHIEVVYGY